MVLSSSSSCKDIVLFSLFSIRSSKFLTRCGGGEGRALDFGADLAQVGFGQRAIRNRFTAAWYVDLQRQEIVAGVHEATDLVEADALSLEVRQDPEIEVVHRQPGR